MSDNPFNKFLNLYYHVLAAVSMPDGAPLRRAQMRERIDEARGRCLDVAHRAGVSVLEVERRVNALHSVYHDWLQQEFRTVRIISDHEGATLQAVQDLGRYFEGFSQAGPSCASPRSESKTTPRPAAPRKCPNEARDAWLAKQRAKSPPRRWGEIYEELGKIAPKKGWDIPDNPKSLSEAYYRLLKRKRAAGKG